MKRFHAVVASAALLALFTFGCQNKKQPEITEQPQPEPQPRLDVSQIPEPEHTAPAPVAVAPAPEPAPTSEITTIEPEPAAPKTAAKSSKTTKAKPKDKYADSSKSAKKSYVVRKGDTLQEISQKYYGTTKNWRKIYNANKSKIKDPNKLQVGTKLDIP